MAHLNRRQMFGVAGLALPASMIGSVAALAAAPAGQPAANATPPPYNPQLGDWCADQAAAAFARIHAGQGTGSDFLQLSRATRLYARHLQDTGTDAVLSVIVPKTAASVDDLSTHPATTRAVTAALNACQKHSGTITRADLSKVLVRPAGSVAHVKTQIGQGGVSSFHHGAADIFANVAKQYGTSSISGTAVVARRNEGHPFLHPVNFQSSATLPAHLQDFSPLPLHTHALTHPLAHGSGVLHPHGGPEAFVQAGTFGSICQKLACFALQNPTLSAAITSAIAVWLTANVDTIAGAVCASDALAEAIGVVLTAGGAVLATPLAISVCAAAVAAAGFLTAGGSTAINVIIANAVAYLIETLGCTG